MNALLGRSGSRTYRCDRDRERPGENSCWLRPARGRVGRAAARQRARGSSAESRSQLAARFIEQPGDRVLRAARSAGRAARTSERTLGAARTRSDRPQASVERLLELSGGKPSLRSPDNYDQIETFRQLGTSSRSTALRVRILQSRGRPSSCCRSNRSEGDIRGIYGNQYATTYVGAITELLVKAGYGDDPRIATTFDWLLEMRQSDGGWAIPMRTFGLSLPRFP